MSEHLQVKNPIYPLISVIASILILVFGLISAKSISGIYFLCGMWLLFLLFGYWKACFAILPVAAVLCAFLAGITYAVSQDVLAAQAAIIRILAVCVGVIPGLALSPILLVRSFSALKVPRTITLGMMITLNFFPLISSEVRQVREAMKTRGAGNVLNPQIFYRAFLIPLLMRLVNISDTLALSVETRGFTTEKDTDYSVYKTVRLRISDLLFLAVVIASAVWAVMA